MAAVQHSGVVPLVAMLRHRVAAGSGVTTCLLYSLRSYEEILYRRELERLSARDDSLEVIHTLTRSRPKDWGGYDRRIDLEMLKEDGPPTQHRPYAFVCGPTPLVEAVATALVGIGHDLVCVKTERFWPTGG